MGHFQTGCGGNPYMTNEFDFSVDWLADASLTSDQRKAWNMLRGELASAQAKTKNCRKDYARPSKLKMNPPS